MITPAERNGISQSAFFKQVKNGMNSYETEKKGKVYAVHLKLVSKKGSKNVPFYSRVKRGMKMLPTRNKAPSKIKESTKTKNRFI
jgi:hypothetical protein